MGGEVEGHAEAPLFDEHRVRRAYAILDVEGKGLEVKDIAKAIQGAGISAPQVEQQLVVEEFLAYRKRTGPLEFAEFISLCHVVIKSETRRLRWAQRMEMFMSEENVTRIAQHTFSQCAHGEGADAGGEGESEEGGEPTVGGEALHLLTSRMGLALDPLLRDRLYEAVSNDGRISQSDFVAHVTSLCMSHPETRQAYKSILRRRQLEERAEIEAIFRLYDVDGSGSIDVAELSAALVECGWDQAHVHQVLSSLPSDHDTTGQGAGGRVQVSLDAFLAHLLAASLYKSVFST